MALGVHIDACRCVLDKKIAPSRVVIRDDRADANRMRLSRLRGRQFTHLLQGGQRVGWRRGQHGRQLVARDETDAPKHGLLKKSFRPVRGQKADRVYQRAGSQLNLVRCFHGDRAGPITQTGPLFAVRLRHHALHAHAPAGQFVSTQLKKLFNRLHRLGENVLRTSFENRDIGQAWHEHLQTRKLAPVIEK